MAAERPLLMSSRLQDPEQKIQFLEDKFLRVAGGAAAFEAADGVVYMVISVRNVGTGLAVMHGWHVQVTRQPQLAHPPLEDFTTQTRDIYVAPGDVGFWQGFARSRHRAVQGRRRRRRGWRPDDAQRPVRRLGRRPASDQPVRAAARERQVADVNGQALQRQPPRPALTRHHQATGAGDRRTAAEA